RRRGRAHRREPRGGDARSVPARDALGTSVDGAVLPHARHPLPGAGALPPAAARAWPARAPLRGRLPYGTRVMRPEVVGVIVPSPSTYSNSSSAITSRVVP